MQSYLFIGGEWDGLTVPVTHGVDAVQMPKAATGNDNYVGETLSVGDASTTIYRHESLTSQQVLDLCVKHYKAWCVKRPGGRH